VHHPSFGVNRRLRSRRWRGTLLAGLLALGVTPVASAGAADLTESFDSWPVNGWTITNLSSPSGATTWFPGTPPSAGGPFVAYNGADSAYAAANFNSTSGSGTISNWFITPRISDLTQGDTISFYTRKHDIGIDYPDRLEVRLSTSATSCDPGTSPTEVGDFTTVLTSINPSLVAGEYPRSWTRYDLTVPAMPPGSGCLAFRYFVTNGGSIGSNSDYIGLDQVEIRDRPDNVEPATTIGNGPAELTASDSATFTYAATPSAGIGSYECRLTLGDETPDAFAACPTNGRTYDDLADGNHTFEVRGVSHGGNVDPTPVSHSFTVDTTAPETSITAGPSGSVATADVAFEYTGTPADDVTGLECRLITADDADPAFASCPDEGREYDDLAEGDYRFEVRAVDAVDNADATPAARSFTVDTTAPVTTILTGPSGTVGAGDLTFTYEGMPTEDVDRFECRLRTADDDDPVFGSCLAEGRTYSDLPSGEYVFEVRAIDAVDNTEIPPASQAFTVDVTAPTVTIASSPAPSSTATSASFSYGSTPSEDVDAVECRLIGPEDADPAFADCPADGISYEQLAVGEYRFELRARDAIGNVSAVAGWPFAVVAPMNDVPRTPPSAEATPPSAGATPPSAGAAPPKSGLPLPAAPQVSGLRLDRTSFRAWPTGRAFGFARDARITARRGTWLRFALDRSTAVELRIYRSVKRRWRPVRGTITRRAHAGNNRVPVHGRFRGTTLRPGIYRLRVTFTDPATKAKTVAVRTLRITR
jgi:hypothetical protein